MNAYNEYIMLLQEFEQKLNRKLNEEEKDFIEWIIKQKHSK